MRGPIALVMTVLTLVSMTSLVSPAAETTGTPYSDADKTFVVTAKEPWAANESMKQSSPAVALALSYGQASPGELAPLFVVLTPPPKGPVTLDALATSMVETAKKRHPAQEGKASISRTKLAGEDARVVTYLLDREGQVVRLKSIIARHNEKFYVLQFFAMDKDFASLAPLADEVFGSFRFDTSH